MSLNFLSTPLVIKDRNKNGFIVRKPKQFELENIFLMGVDVWGEGISQKEYLTDCENSVHYKIGTWYVLEKENKILSSLTTYQLPRLGNFTALGIASIATNPIFRKKGYAKILVESVIASFKEEYNVKIFILFSDINPEYYGKLGFKELSNEIQPYKDTTCMAHCPKEIFKLVEKEFNKSGIRYF